VKVKNPASIGPALLLVGFVMAMTVAARWVEQRYGDSGLMLMLAASGTLDVDSAVITMGSLPPGTLSARMAALALLAPMVLNTVFKASIAMSIARWSAIRPADVTLSARAVAARAGARLFWLRTRA